MVISMSLVLQYTNAYFQSNLEPERSKFLARFKEVGVSGVSTMTDGSFIDEQLIGYDGLHGSFSVFIGVLYFSFRDLPPFLHELFSNPICFILKKI